LLWDIETGQLLHSPIGHDWLIREIHFSPDGKRLLSNTSGDMIVWDVATSRPIASFQSDRFQQWISLAADGESVRYLDWIFKPSPRRMEKRGLNERGLSDEEEEKRPSGTEMRTIYRWNVTTDRKEKQTAFSIPAACDWFVLSPDGQRVASVDLSAGPQVSLRDVKGGKPAVLAALPDNSRVHEVLFSPNGRRLLLRTWYGALRVVDSVTGQLVRDLKPDSSGRRIGSTPIFASDGRSVVWSDGQLCLREVASGKDRLQLSLPTQGYSGSRALALSPDGRFLAWSTYGSNDGNVHVFSTATGKRLARWWGVLGTSEIVAFSLDSRLLATGGFDGSLLLWKLPEKDGLPNHLSPEETATFWQALADDDAARAFRALAGLAAAPAQAVPLIKDRFPSIWNKPDAKRLARLVAELDDDAFAVRERSTRELSEAGVDAADALRQALANDPSPEARRRLKKLLDRLQEGNDSKRLRALRAIEVLERIGSPQAKDVLRSLTGKPLPPELKEEVQASLRRMDAKPSR
jgi:WD40 repeat protein